MGVISKMSWRKRSGRSIFFQVGKHKGRKTKNFWSARVSRQGRYERWGPVPEQGGGGGRKSRTSLKISIRQDRRPSFSKEVGGQFLRRVPSHWSRGGTSGLIWGSHVCGGQLFAYKKLVWQTGRRAGFRGQETPTRRVIQVVKKFEVLLGECKSLEK